MSLSWETVASLQEAERQRPGVRRVRLSDGREAVWKGYWGSAGWYRHTVGRLAISNEVRAYRALEGVKGVPRVLARPSPDSFLVEFVDGASLRDLEPGQLPWDAVVQTRQLIAAMHARGVVHGDLGHDWHGKMGRDANLVWGNDGTMYIIDFASAFFRQGWSLGLYRVFEPHDRLVITKLLRRFFPDRTREPEYSLQEQLGPWTLRILNLLKKL